MCNSVQRCCGTALRPLEYEADGTTARRGPMNVNVIEEPGRRELEVTVRIAPGDPRGQRIAERVRTTFGRLTGYPTPGSPERHVIALDTVTHIETTERRAWIHTSDHRRLESPLRLFELEELLQDSECVRVSRQELVNLDHVTALRPEPNGRLALVLDDRYVAIATRTYAADIKRRIGIAR